MSAPRWPRLYFPSLKLWVGPCLGLLFLSAPLPHAFGSSAGAPEKQAAEVSLLCDCADGELDDHDLLEGALIASGVADEFRRVRYLQRFWQQASSLTRQELQGSPSQRADLILRWLHKEILVGVYQAEVTRLEQTLDRGDFNCVTATVLYQCLTERMGLSLVPIAIRGHVYCRCYEGEYFDVQTTCDDWFEVRSMRPSQAHGRLPTSAASPPRRLDSVQLLGKIYYNRALREIDSKNFAAASRLLEIALQLDPLDQAARENQLATANNWALAECQADEFERAAEILSDAMADAPHYPPFVRNELHIYQQWTLALCKDGKHAEAVRLLEAGYHRRPNAELFSHGRYAVIGLWAESLFISGKIEEAWELLEQARRDYGPNEQLLAYELAAAEGAATALLSAGNRDVARSVLEGAFERHPDVSRLSQRLRRLTTTDS